MRPLLTTLASFISWHRRAVGALLAAGSVLLLASNLTAQPPTHTVVALAAELPAAHQITAADLSLRDLPLAAIPDGALRNLDDALGHTTAVALSANTVLQAGTLTGTLTLEEGRVVVPISVPDAELRALLRPGDVVSLVVPGPDGLEVLTTDARVVTHPTVEPPGPQTGLATGRDSGLLLVDVATADAGLVASLGQAGQVGLVLGQL